MVTQRWLTLGLVALMALLARSGIVGAAEPWQVDYANSRIGFIASYDGVEFPGVFERWQGQFKFAPDQLADSTFEITVDMASVNTRSRDRDAGIRSEEWFAVEQFGAARYETEHFRHLGDARFEAHAQFRIKNVTQPLVSTFTWTGEADARRLQGQVTVDRRTLNIGTGEWASDPIIGFGVTITYDIALRR